VIIIKSKNQKIKNQKSKNQKKFPYLVIFFWFLIFDFLIFNFWFFDFLALINSKISNQITQNSKFENFCNLKLPKRKGSLLKIEKQKNKKQKSKNQKKITIFGNFFLIFWFLIFVFLFFDFWFSEFLRCFTKLIFSTWRYIRYVLWLIIANHLIVLFKNFFYFNTKKRSGIFFFYVFIVFFLFKNRYLHLLHNDKVQKCQKSIYSDFSFIYLCLINTIKKNEFKMILAQLSCVSFVYINFKIHYTAFFQ
jgi:hypothetical protein